MESFHHTFDETLFWNLKGKDNWVAAIICFELRIPWEKRGESLSNKSIKKKVGSEFTNLAEILTISTSRISNSKTIIIDGLYTKSACLHVFLFIIKKRLCFTI